MGFKKGNQNIDSVFYGTDYVERMYLGKNQFFQASYLDFYKTNFFSIGLGQEKRQIDNPMGDGAISYIKTEWSSQYGYQLEVNQAFAGRHTNYTDTVFKEKFSFMLPEGEYLLKVNIKNIPSSESKGTLGCNLLKKEDNTSILTNPVFYNGTAVGFSVSEDTEVYLGIYINDLNPEKTSIFSLELSPAEKVNEKFVEKPSLMVRGRKKEIYNAVYTIDITIPKTAFYEGVSYPVEYIDSDAFNYEVTENGKTVSQPLTRIFTITVEGNSMVGFGNRAFKNCSNCRRFSCISRAFRGGLFANNAAFEKCGALETLNLSIVKNINGLKENGELYIIMEGRRTYSFDDSFAGSSVKYIYWRDMISSSGVVGDFTANFGEGSFKGCAKLKSIINSDSAMLLDTVFNVGSAAFEGCTSLNSVGIGSQPTTTGPLYSSIGSQAFSGCTGLTSVELYTKEGAETIIGSQAFENCTGITSVNLPNTVTSIGSQAFSGCSSLETITIPFIGESATSTNNKFSYIFGTVPASLTTVNFSKDNEITKIPDYAFQGCSNITSINGNDTENIVSIGNYGYAGTGITSMRLSSALTNVGSSAFNGCTGLTSVRFEKTNNYVTRKIGSGAFANCSNLTGVEVPGGFSNGVEGETGQWFSTEAAKTWAVNQFNTIFSNPLSIAKHLKTTDESLEYQPVENFYFSSSDGYALTNYLYCYLQGTKLIVSADSIGSYAFYNSSFNELSLNFKNVYTSKGEKAQKIYIGEQAFSEASFVENVQLDATVSEESVVPIVFGADAFKGLKITNGYFVFVPGKEYWGSCCYFYNADANPCYQENIKLAYSETGSSSPTEVTQGYFNTNLQQQASALGINIKNYGYQYVYAKEDKQNPVKSLYVTGDYPWTAPDECFLNCFGVLENFNLGNHYVEYIGYRSFYKTGFQTTAPLNILSLMGPDQKGLVISDEAFAGCTGLSDLLIANLHPFDGNYAIGYRAFAECSDLNTVSLYSLTPIENQTYARFDLGVFADCPNIETMKTCSFSAAKRLTGLDTWKNSFFYLFNTKASVLLAAAANYYVTRQSSLACYLPPSLKTFELRSPSEDFSKNDWNYVGFWAVEGSWAQQNPTQVAPIFKKDVGKTTVKIKTGAEGNQAFENNKGKITRNFY